MWTFIGLVVSFGLGFGIGKQYAVNKAAQRPSFILYSDVECRNEVMLKDTPDGYAVMNRLVPSEDDERRWEKIWSALIRYRHPIIKECIEKIQVLYDVKISGWDK